MKTARSAEKKKFHLLFSVVWMGSRSTLMLHCHCFFLWFRWPSCSRRGRDMWVGWKVWLGTSHPGGSYFRLEPARRSFCLELKDNRAREALTKSVYTTHFYFAHRSQRMLVAAAAADTAVACTRASLSRPTLVPRDAKKWSDQNRTGRTGSAAPDTGREGLN